MKNAQNQPVKKEGGALGHLERTQARPVFAPDVDIKETNEELVVFADLPGVPDKNVDITLENGVLTIRGTVVAPPADENKEYILQEYAVGDYERAFTLSEEVDQERIRAKAKNGVLEIHLPKTSSAKSRRIEVVSD